jgi:hypothetical protein
VSTEPHAVDEDHSDDDPEAPSEDASSVAAAPDQDASLDAPDPAPPAVDANGETTVADSTDAPTAPDTAEAGPSAGQTDVVPPPTEILDQAPTTAPSDPPTGGPAAPVPAPLSTGPDTASASDVPDEDATEDATEAATKSRLWPTIVGVGLVIAVLAAGVAAGFLLAPDRDESSGSGGGAKRPLEPPAAGVFDSFARSSGQLGTADSGQSWEEVAGDWTVDGSAVAVTTPSDSGPSLAVVNLQASDGVVQVTMPEPARASGIVFRYENPFNHWAITAAPGSATWVISKVENGEFETVDTLGTAPVDANTTLTVDFDGGWISVYVDGLERTTLRDDFLDGARRAGLVARGPDAASARWTNFVAFGLDG